MELALFCFKGFLFDLKVWGIFVIIGNMEEVVVVLMGNIFFEKCWVIWVDIFKVIEIEFVLLDEVDCFFWVGYLGIKLVEKIIFIINGS